MAVLAHWFGQGLFATILFVALALGGFRAPMSVGLATGIAAMATARKTVPKWAKVSVWLPVAAAIPAANHNAAPVWAMSAMAGNDAALKRIFEKNRASGLLSACAAASCDG